LELLFYCLLKYLFIYFFFFSIRILGPTALLQLAEKKESLPSINRPMYTQTLLGTVVVFTGFRKKDELVTKLFSYNKANYILDIKNIYFLITNNFLFKSQN
jgi:hypothetical protein